MTVGSTDRRRNEPSGGAGLRRWDRFVGQDRRLHGDRLGIVAVRVVRRRQERHETVVQQLVDVDRPQKVPVVKVREIDADGRLQVGQLRRQPRDVLVTSQHSFIIYSTESGEFQCEYLGSGEQIVVTPEQIHRRRDAIQIVLGHFHLAYIDAKWRYSSVKRGRTFLYWYRNAPNFPAVRSRTW